jgi:hypothetical protein
MNKLKVFFFMYKHGIDCTQRNYIMTATRPFTDVMSTTCKLFSFELKKYTTVDPPCYINLENTLSPRIKEGPDGLIYFKQLNVLEACYAVEIRATNVSFQKEIFYMNSKYTR